MGRELLRHGDNADVGLHFNLTLGRPLGPMPVFAPKGNFPTVAKVIRMALRGKLPLAEIRAEIDRHADVGALQHRRRLGRAGAAECEERPQRQHDPDHAEAIADEACRQIVHAGPGQGPGAGPPKPDRSPERRQKQQRRPGNARWASRGGTVGNL